MAVAAKDVEQSDCYLDTSKLLQRNWPPPARTSEAWWLHPVDIQANEEMHLALPDAGLTLPKLSPFQCLMQLGVPRQGQHGLKVPVTKNLQRWAVETGAASRAHRCSHAPQRLEHRRKIACRSCRKIACRSVRWTAAVVVAWHRPGPPCQKRYTRPLVC